MYYTPFVSSFFKGGKGIIWCTDLGVALEAILKIVYFLLTRSVLLVKRRIDLADQAFQNKMYLIVFNHFIIEIRGSLFGLY